MKLTALRGRSVWITGASSGIGLELASLAAEAGSSLILISSRETALREAARICEARGASSVKYRVIDLSDSQRTFNETQNLLREHGAPDYLILNAGVSQRALAGDTDLAVTRRIMDINFFGAVAAARALIPGMAEAGGGRIGVSSSIVGEFGFPLRSAYSAGKKALNGYFETVGLEYAKAGIRVTLVMPGRIRTPISINSLEADGRRHGVMDPGQAKGMDAGRCARKYWKAVIRGRREAIIGGMDTLMVFLHRCFPPLFRFIAGRSSPL